MKVENISFEEAFARLESIVEILESGEISLDKSIELFEEGMELTKFCSDKLNKAELKIQKLVKDNNQLKLDNFE